jgi:putative membrane protein
MSALLVAAFVLLGLAALVHLYIFWLESISWTTPTTWRRFGVRSQEDADVIRPMAYNQGFYNGLLAVEVVAGLVLVAGGPLAITGAALVIFGALSMVLAATVLVLSSPRLARAALLQGGLPLVGGILLGTDLATRWG